MTVEATRSLIPVLRSPGEMQQWSRERRAAGKTIGCVPTMGALHDGHLSLVKASAAQCDETILTVFVNPLQFGPSEDYGTYPRDEERDLRLAHEAGATAAYCPSVEAIYHHDRSVSIVEETLGEVLCGASRPTHFRGVLIVVAKLFNACLPDRAYFGRKDYQQLLVIKRMVRDLDFPIVIVACPIIREPDGLAISSRNRYLSPTEREDALCLSKGIAAAEAAFRDGERNAGAIERAARDVIEAVAGARIDYVECRDAEILEDIETIERPALLALAVFIGETRLIDNTVLTP